MLARNQPLRIGNGHIAFGLDVTGLQTFMLHGSFSHATLSDRGWYTAANPERFRRIIGCDMISSICLADRTESDITQVAAAVTGYVGRWFWGGTRWLKG